MISPPISLAHAALVMQVSASASAQPPPTPTTILAKPLCLGATCALQLHCSRECSCNNPPTLLANAYNEVSPTHAYMLKQQHAKRHMQQKGELIASHLSEALLSSCFGSKSVRNVLAGLLIVPRSQQSSEVFEFEASTSGEWQASDRSVHRKISRLIDDLAKVCRKLLKRCWSSLAATVIIITKRDMTHFTFHDSTVSSKIHLLQSNSSSGSASNF